MRIELDADSLRALARALKSEEDGKALRKELAASLKSALAPAVTEAKASVMGMSSAGAGGSPALRATIARGVQARVRLSGRSTGASVRAKRTPGLRNFPNAPKRTNRRKGWRHPVFNTDTWVSQTGKPDWFDEPMRRGRGGFRAAVKDAMESLAQRLADRIR